jgi:hypothetical protein
MDVAVSAQVGVISTEMFQKLKGMHTAISTTMVNWLYLDSLNERRISEHSTGDPGLN